MFASQPTQQTKRKHSEVEDESFAEAASRKKMNFSAESYKQHDDNIDQRASEPQRLKHTIPVNHPMYGAFRFIEKKLAEARQKREALEHQGFTLDDELGSALARLSIARAEEAHTERSLQDFIIFFGQGD
ncbi:hypothetical protein NW762_011930 [Fusarium torreyae]|uniref:Uncharacterized protein n=1 Tax=Fusarium torreyae TaxID=1237075 RepID=A0A9W8V8R8_9HYPO|nr:hypothetical protein NW762_011930 [Fusarium torreyae]